MLLEGLAKARSAVLEASCRACRGLSVVSPRSNTWDVPACCEKVGTWRAPRAVEVLTALDWIWKRAECWFPASWVGGRVFAAQAIGVLARLIDGFETVQRLEVGDR